MEQTVCSETSAYKIQTPGNYPEENIQHRLRMFENRVLRKIFGPKRDEFTGEWRKLHNQELYDRYCSPDIIRVIKSKRM